MTNATTETVTLLDYANAREYVVLFWTSVGTPMGSHVPFGHPDLDFADRNSLLELSGTIDADGGWDWDGEGDMVDDRDNTILRVQAYPDARKWAAIVEEFESEG